VLKDARAGRTSIKDFILNIFNEAHKCFRDYFLHRAGQELLERSFTCCPRYHGFSRRVGGKDFRDSGKPNIEKVGANQGK